MIRESETECKERTAKKARFYRVFFTFGRLEADGTAFWPRWRSLLASAGSRCPHRVAHLLNGRDPVHEACRQQPEHFAQLPIDLAGLLRILLEEDFGVVPPLPDPLAFEGIPGAALLHDVICSRQVEQIAFA